MGAGAEERQGDLDQVVFFGHLASRVLSPNTGDGKVPVRVLSSGGSMYGSETLEGIYLSAHLDTVRP